MTDDQQGAPGGEQPVTRPPAGSPSGESGPAGPQPSAHPHRSVLPPPHQPAWKLGSASRQQRDGGAPASGRRPPGSGSPPAGAAAGSSRSGPGSGGGRGTPDPSAAGQRLMRQISLARRARRQRLALAMAGLMSVLTLLISGSAWVLTSYVSSSLGRVDAGTSGTPSSGPVNILIAGVDTRGGPTRRQNSGCTSAPRSARTPTPSCWCTSRPITRALRSSACRETLG